MKAEPVATTSVMDSKETLGHSTAMSMKASPNPKSSAAADAGGVVTAKNGDESSVPLQQSASPPEPPTVKSNSPSKRSNSRKHASRKKMTVSLSKIQKQQVDAVFEDLFGYKWGTSPLIEERLDDECSQLLQRIFGTKGAAKVLHQFQRQGVSTQAISIRFGAKAAVPKRDVSPTRLHPQRTKVNPTVVPSNASAAFVTTKSARPANTDMPASSPAPASGADAVLQQMQGKKQTSTIMKTAMDWESFKDQSGTLGEKLEQHAESKGAYLKRQDFLTRVDHRQFEQERDERERNRAKKN